MHRREYDTMSRRLLTMRDIPKGDSRLLPGKLAGVFDLRRQQWRTVMFQPTHIRTKVLARELVEELPAGTLVVADTSASPGSTGSPTGDTTG